MENNRWREIERIFDEALEHDDAERTAFLQAACAGDEMMRNEVETLLLAHQKAQQVTGGFLASPLGKTNGTPKTSKLGSYQLMHEIARGGMGTVWLAQRADQQFQQQVAIKLIHAGADREDILRRFQHERQILADLNHPNIARLLDGGTTEDGRPYFVMEYIEGLPIDEYCQQHQLSVRERLQLFRQVCAAVQYAHQNLILHRDLKPGNILVTADGTPKLLDFGIAKLLRPDLSQSYQTQAEQTPMTPAYASPEQVRGEKLTTTSDVYSLGVLLYELLTGRSPYQLKEKTFNEMMRAIIEQEPERPSQAVSRNTVPIKSCTTENADEKAAMRNASLPEPLDKLRRHLSGDLDAIVLKTLRKEPHLRYSSVEQLSDDIRRYLEGLPTLARKGSFTYRTMKYVRRYKVPVAAAALILLSLLGGIGATSRQAQIARAEQAKAEAQRIRAEQASALADEQRRRAEQALAEVEAQRARAENALTTAEQRRQQAEAARTEANQQRAQAETQRLAAEAERNVAQTQRQRAEAQELAKRRLLYASQMKLAQAAWDESNVERVRELLTAHQPAPGQEDLRGFEWNWLWRLSHAEVITLPKHSVAPTAGFSADGKNLITRSLSLADKVTAIRIWDAATWREKGSFRVSGRLGMAVISPAGDLVAMTFAAGCEVVLWDVASTQVLWRLPMTGNCPKSLKFSPDSKRLLAFGQGQIILFDTQAGRELIRFNVDSLPTESPDKVAFSPDGKTIAKVGLDFQVHFYDLQTGKEVQTMARPDVKEKIYSISYSPTGRYQILRVSTTKHYLAEMIIQDTQTQQEVQRLEAQPMPIFSPNEKFLVVPKDREITILDTEKWQERASFKVQNVEMIAFAPQSDRFVTTELDAVKIWDLNVSPAATSYAINDALANRITFSPDSKKIYVNAYSAPQVNNYSIVKGWELATQRETNSFLNAGSPTARHSLSPDGSKLAYSSQQEIIIKDTHTNAELLRFKTDRGTYQDISWSSDGGKLVTVIGTTIWIWDARTGQVLRSIPDPVGAALFRKAVLLHDQKTLLLLGEVGLYFYDLTTKQISRTVPMRNVFTSGMTLSADETKIAVGWFNGEVHLYDATNGEKLLTLKGHSRHVNQMSFSSDNRRLATSSGDSTVRVWDLLTGQEMLLFRDTSYNGGVAFSPDGEHLAVAFQKGVVKVFSAAK